MIRIKIIFIKDLIPFPISPEPPVIKTVFIFLNKIFLNKLGKNFFFKKKTGNFFFICFVQGLGPIEASPTGVRYIKIHIYIYRQYVYR